MNDTLDANWMDDDAKLDHAHEMLNSIGGAGDFATVLRLVKSWSTVALRMVAELAESIYDAEQEDTELDRDSFEFVEQQDELQAIARLCHVTINQRAKADDAVDYEADFEKECFG